MSANTKVDLHADRLPWWFWYEDCGDVMRKVWEDPARPTICEKGFFEADPVEWWGFMAEQLWAMKKGYA